MRWDESSRIHFPDSMMRMRGEDASMFSSSFFGENQRAMVRKQARTSRTRGPRDTHKNGKRPLRPSTDGRGGAQVRARSEPVVGRHTPTRHGPTERTDSAYACLPPTTRGEHAASGQMRSVGNTGGGE